MRIYVSLLALLVYLAIPTKNYYWDGISFAQNIESFAHWPDLFHPNHLIYNCIGWLAYKSLGGAVRALYVLQVLNAIFAALTVYVLSGIRSDLLLSIAFAFSGTWWRFSTDADAYILSILLLTICTHFLLLSEKPRPLLVALIHTAAMLVHQLAFLFVPAAIYCLWRKSRAAALLYLAVAGPATIAAYFVAFHLQTGFSSFHAFLSWTASHANDVSFSFQLLKNLGISIRSWLQLFFVGRPSIVRYSDPLTIFLLALSVIVLVLLIVELAKRTPKSKIVRSPQLTFALIWFASYAIFLIFWLPNNTFYKLFGLPAIILALPRAAITNWRSPAALSVALMVLFNLNFAIIPYSRETANPAIEFALGLRQPLNGGSIVYFKDFNTDDWFARYFTPSAKWKPLEPTSAIDADLRSGKSVWLETTAIDTLSNTEPVWLSHRLQGADWHQLVNAKHHIRFVRLSAAN